MNQLLRFAVRPLTYLTIAWMVATTAFGQGKDQDAYPSRPIRIIMPGSVGSGSDIATRVLAEQMAIRLSQNVVVDNRTGANGSIGAAAAARAAPDGYTLFVGTIATLALNQHLFDNLGYDPDKDIEPLIMTGFVPMLIATNVSSPYKDLSDLLRAAKAKPNAIAVAVANTTSRLTLELLQQEAGVKLFPVPFNTTPAALNGVLGDQMPLIIDTVAGGRALVQAGKLRGLAVTSANASELLAGVPSVREQGLNNFEVIAWNLLAVPKGTSDEIKTRLVAVVQGILRDDGYRQRLRQSSFDPAPAEGFGNTPLAYVRSERARWGALIKAKDIKP